MEFTTFLLTCSTAAVAAAAIQTNWYGLGPNACYRETCLVGQFCSNSGILSLRGCRNCTDVAHTWCKESVPEKFIQEYPSCEATCKDNVAKAREDALRHVTDHLQKQVQDLKAESVDLRSSLDEEKQKRHQTERELNATGIELTNALAREKTSRAETDALRNGTVEQKWLYVIAGVAVVLLVLLVIACTMLRRISSRSRTNNRASTAVLAKKPTRQLWRFLECCFGIARQLHVAHPESQEQQLLPRPVVPNPTQANPGQPNDVNTSHAPGNNSQPNLTQPTAALVVSCQPMASDDRLNNPLNNYQPARTSEGSDSNHSLSESLASQRSSLCDRVAPGVGTEHHFSDQLDFNRSTAADGAPQIH